MQKDTIIIKDLLPGKYEISIVDENVFFNIYQPGYCYNPLKQILSEYDNNYKPIQTIDLLPDVENNIEFTQTGYILHLTTENEDDIQIENKEKGVSLKYHIIPEVNYKYCTQLNEVYSIKPLSDNQYINNNYVLSHSNNNIKLELSPIDDIRTLYISGKIVPPLEGATVNAIDNSDKNLIYSNQTNNLGEYMIGPLYNSREYISFIYYYYILNLI